MSTVTAVPLQPTRPRVLVYLWAALTVAALAAAALVWFTPVDPIVRAMAQVRRSDPTIRSTNSGLLYKVIQPGSGDTRPTDEDAVTVAMQVHLLDGTTVLGGDQPGQMPVAPNLPGLTEGLKLMPPHSHYRFWLKPSLGLGDRATPTIPANSPLVVDVQLMDFRSQAVIQQEEAMRQMQAQMQQRGGAGAPGGPGGAPGAPPPGMVDPGAMPPAGPPPAEVPHP